MENIQRRTPLTLENSKKSDAIAVLAVLSTIKSFVAFSKFVKLILDAFRETDFTNFFLP